MPAFRPTDLAAWCGGAWEPGPPAAVSGVSVDTRTLAAGDLYVALRGVRFDGHAFVPEAFRKGAAGAVVARTQGNRSRSGGPLLWVADTAAALLRMAAGYRESLQALVIGVTGSAGKTTVKELIADLLSVEAPVARTRGNWNNPVGLPLSLLAADPGAAAGVFEVGTGAPGELEPLCRALRPAWGVVTSIGPAHIERFGSVEAIAEEKAVLVEQLPATGTAFLNRDGVFFERLAAGTDARVVTVSRTGAGDYFPVAGRPEGGFRVRETRSGDERDLASPGPGAHGVVNALLAVAVARTFGVRWESLDRAMSRFEPPPMRWQTVMVHGVRYINDAYNANPLSMRAALEALRLCEVPGRRWLVLGGMLELGEWTEQSHRELGLAAAGCGAAGMVAVGDLGGLVADAARGGGMARVAVCETPAEAAELISSWAAPGDAVLVKASRGVGLERVLEHVRAAARGGAEA